MSRISGTLKNCISLFVPVIVFNNCNFGAEKDKPGLYTIEIKQMQFVPASLKIHTGDTVVWVNHDFVTHDVTEITKKAWNSQPLAAGASWRMIVKTSADYYCSIHQVMKGRLIAE